MGSISLSFPLGSLSRIYMTASHADLGARMRDTDLAAYTLRNCEVKYISFLQGHVPLPLVGKPLTVSM